MPQLATRISANFHRLLNDEINEDQKTSQKNIYGLQHESLIPAASVRTETEIESSNKEISRLLSDSLRKNLMRLIKFFQNL